jgi:cytoplasmic iron level regulating protein YaaA (DUF328/UPF0246 family)
MTIGESLKIIISPAKKMHVNTDDLAWRDLPVFIDRAEVLMSWIRSLSYEEQKKLWACNDAIAEVNHERFANMDLRKNLTPAILSYDGIQYTCMAPIVFEDKAFVYVQEHLRILSGFYGILRPLDGVVPYRLEMQAKAKVSGCRDLYKFWGSSLYDQLTEGNHVILNLASNEYAKSIRPYLSSSDRWITCIFGDLINEKIVQKGVYAKMARGDMVAYLAEKRPETEEDLLECLRAFNVRGYFFSEERSTDDTLVFIRGNKYSSLIKEHTFNECGHQTGNRRRSARSHPHLE